MSVPAVSLVICTRDRAPQLARALKSLEAIRFDRPWELVLVDNGSSDGTPDLLAEFSRRFAVTARVVREEQRGLARARNRGLALASGELVAFTDDDCYPAPDFLARIYECFAESSTLGFLGGRILRHDPDDLPMTILPASERRDFPPPSFVRPGAVQGANMAFRRRALLEVGGFDIRLGAGTAFACEDIDVVARLSAAGWPGAYDPRPLVYHHHGRKTRAELRTLVGSYLDGAGAYYLKCLSEPQLRGACARHWLARWAMKPHQAARETRAAVDFWRTTRSPS